MSKMTKCLCLPDGISWDAELGVLKLGQFWTNQDSYPTYTAEFELVFVIPNISQFYLLPVKNEKQLLL